MASGPTSPASTFSSAQGKWQKSPHHVGWCELAENMDESVKFLALYRAPPSNWDKALPTQEAGSPAEIDA